MSAQVIAFPSNAKTVPDGHYTGPDLAAVAGITYRQLDHWCRTGYLHPLESTPGSGKVRAFPPSDVALASLVKRLLDAGMLPRQAFDLAHELLEHGGAEFAGIRIDLPQDL